MICVVCGKQFDDKRKKCCSEECTKIRRKEKTKQWRQKNATKINEWREKHKDRLRKYIREYMVEYFKDEQKKRKHRDKMKKYRDSKKNV